MEIKVAERNILGSVMDIFLVQGELEQEDMTFSLLPSEISSEHRIFFIKDIQGFLTPIEGFYIFGKYRDIIPFTYIKKS